MMNSIKSLLSVLSLFSLTACYITTTTGPIYDPYYGAWFDAFGRVCGYTPYQGCNYYANGAKIMVWQDPYYYYGVPVNGFWTSPNGIIYNNGYALNSSDDSESADVLAQASVKEAQFVASMGKTFADRYALNETTGIMVAENLRAWALIGKDRSRTDQDAALFLKRMYGIQPDQAEKVIIQAMSTKNTDAILDLNADVAAHWGTTPEVSKQILKNWYKNEAQALGL